MLANQPSACPPLCEVYVHLCCNCRWHHLVATKTAAILRHKNSSKTASKEHRFNSSDTREQIKLISDEHSTPMQSTLLGKQMCPNTEHTQVTSAGPACTAGAALVYLIIGAGAAWTAKAGAMCSSPQALVHPKLQVLEQ